MTDINIKIKNLLNSLNSNVLNLKRIKYQMDLISQINEIKQDAYLYDLLNPGSRRGVRIPSQFPIPSATFQLRSSIKFSSNPKGCFLWHCNPFFLGNPDLIGAHDDKVLQFQGREVVYRNFVCPPISTFGCIDFENLDGKHEITGINSLLRAVDIGQILPGYFYDQYRLVSAEVVVKYIGPMEDGRGIIGGSISFDPLNNIFCSYYNDVGIRPQEVGPYDPFRSTDPCTVFLKPEYSVFDNLRHMLFNKENSCMEGLRMLYFPIDNSYEEFSPICSGKFVKFNYLYYFSEDSGFGALFDLPSDQLRPGFNWIIYGQDLPPSKEYFKMDIFCNFECLPSAEFMNYCPLEVNPYNIKLIEKQNMLEKIKELAIQKYR